LKQPRRELIVGIVSIVLFFIITTLVFSNLTQSVDANAALIVNNAGLGDVGSWLVVFFANYGREAVWGLVVLAMLLLGGKTTKLLAIELGLLLIGGIIIGSAAKTFLVRPRPFEVINGITLRIPPEYNSSYPSGHALIVSIGAVFCLSRFRRKALAAVLAFEAAIVCYSRVYVGVHYPLDVIGGVFLGTTIALEGVNILEKYLSRFLQELSEIAVKILRDGPLNL
jgi:membrane-associated phospholipid phosphatase